jgi:hypothetical protein
MVKHALSALLGFPLLALLATGCASTSNHFDAGSSTTYAVASGNWAITPQISDQISGPVSSPSGQQSGPIALPTASGSLTRAVNGSVNGIFRLSPAPACLPANGDLAISGDADAQGQLHLSSAPINGAVWSLTGQLATDGKMLTAGTVSLGGGACPTVTASAAGTFYTPISGTYSGSFTDTHGVTVPVSTTLTQTSAPDPNGQYHLAGNATFPSNSCFTSPAVTDSLVTGNALSATYSQQQGSDTSTVTAAGTFSSDATTLTISGYSIAGGDCDGDAGAGLLTKQ